MAGKRNANDQRNKLVESYIQFIKLVAPQVIIFENVHGFTVNFKDKKGAKQYSMYVEQALTEEGYQVAHSIIDMSHFGIPQNRKRFILVAMKGHDPKRVFAVLAESREAFCKEKGIMCTTSVRDAISDLENHVEPFHPQIPRDSMPEYMVPFNQVIKNLCGKNSPLIPEQ